MKFKESARSAVLKVLRPITPLPVVHRYHRRRRIQYIKALRPPYVPSRPTILAINHHCDQDYRALARVNDRFNFVEVKASSLFLGSSRYFSDEVEFIRAAYDSEPSENVQSYRRESRLIFDRIMERYPFDVILVPNDNYFFVRELIDIAHGHGIPTIILDKEGIITPYSFEAESRRAREFTPLVADHILVWSFRQKSFWMEKGVEEDRITVVGQPRSDLLFLPPGDQLSGYFDRQRPIVTVFSYLDTAYIPHESVALNGASWRQMKAETHRIVGELAARHPEFNFVIKCHPLQRDIEDIRSKFESKNLRVIGGSSLGNELLARSDLIIAFQTTALIEAMLIGREAIYTGWDPQIRELEDHMLPFGRAKGIVKAESPEALREVANRFLSGNRSDFAFSEHEIEKRREFVAEYLYRPDGHAAERVLDELEKFLP